MLARAEALVNRLTTWVHDHAAADLDEREAVVLESGRALLGELADLTNIDFVYRVCSFFPAIGILTWFLPNLERATIKRERAAV